MTAMLFIIRKIQKYTQVNKSSLEQWFPEKLFLPLRQLRHLGVNWLMNIGNFKSHEFCIINNTEGMYQQRKLVSFESLESYFVQRAHYCEQILPPLCAIGILFNALCCCCTNLNCDKIMTWQVTRSHQRWNKLILLFCLFV